MKKDKNLDTPKEPEVDCPISNKLDPSELMPRVQSMNDILDSKTSTSVPAQIQPGCYRFIYFVVQ